MEERRKLRITDSDYDPASIYIPRGSDKRVSGGVDGACGLCGLEKTLRLSHIVPRWMYKWAKAEGTIVGDYKTLGIRTAEEDGRKHYLLCDACEQYLGESENYVAILQDEGRGADRAARGLCFHDDERVTGLDYDLILRFLTSIALKASLVDSPPYHNVRFSEAYIEDCRRVLNGQEPVQSFSFFAMRFQCEVSEDIDPRAMVYVHRNYYQDMGEAFVILAAGWEWDLIRHKNSVDEWPELFRESPIRRGEPTLIPWGEITDHRFLQPEETEQGIAPNP